MLLQIGGWNVLYGAAHAVLQRADVGGNAPAVVRSHTRGVARHGAKTIRHHVEKMSNRRVRQLGCEIGRRLPIASTHNHALAVAETAVAGGAVYIEALLAAQHVVLRDGDREIVDVVVVDLAGIARLVEPQVPACDGSFYLRASGTMVREKFAFGEGFVFRLVLHVLAASGEA